MKWQYNTVFTLAGILFLIYSCKQVNDDLPEQLEAEVDEVVNIIADNLLTVNIIGGGESQGFRSGRFLGGEDSYLSISSQDRVLKPIPMIACMGLEPDRLQDIRRLLFVFENCKSKSMVTYKEEIRKLMTGLEGRRLELLENFHSGAVSREKYQIQLEELRYSYSSILEELKVSYKVELIPCLITLVSRLQKDLGREDWLEFRKCISGI